MSDKMPNFENLCNKELRKKCLEYGLPNVPVNDSTRSILLRRLRAAMSSSQARQEEKMDVYHMGEVASTSKQTRNINDENNESCNIPELTPVKVRQSRICKAVTNRHSSSTLSKPEYIDVDDSDEESVEDAMAKTKGMPTRLSSLRVKAQRKFAANTSAPKVARRKSIPVEDGPSSSNRSVPDIALKWKRQFSDVSSDSDVEPVKKVTEKMTLTSTRLSGRRRGIALKWKRAYSDVSSGSDEAAVKKITAKMTLTSTRLSAKKPTPKSQNISKIIAETSSPRNKLPPLDEGPSCSNIAVATIGQRNSTYIDVFNDAESTPTSKAPKRPNRLSANESPQTPATSSSSLGGCFPAKEIKPEQLNVSSASAEEEPVKNTKAKRSKIPIKLSAREPVLKNQTLRTDIATSSPKIFKKTSSATASSNIPVPARHVTANESRGLYSDVSCHTDDEPAQITTITESSTKLSAKETLKKSQPLSKTVDVSTSYEQIKSKQPNKSCDSTDIESNGDEGPTLRAKQLKRPETVDATTSYEQIKSKHPTKSCETTDIESNGDEEQELSAKPSKRPETVDATTSYEQIKSEHFNKSCDTNEGIESNGVEEPKVSAKPSQSPTKSPAQESSAKSKILSNTGNSPTAYVQTQAASAIKKTVSFAVPIYTTILSQDDYIQSSEERNNLEIKKSTTSSNIINKFNDNADLLSKEDENTTVVAEDNSIGRNIHQTRGNLSDFSRKFEELKALENMSYRRRFGRDENNPICINIHQTPFLSDISRNVQELQARENISYRRHISTAGYTGTDAHAESGSSCTASANITHRRLQDDSADDSEFLRFIISFDKKYYIKETILVILFLIVVFVYFFN